MSWYANDRGQLKWPMAILAVMVPPILYLTTVQLASPWVWETENFNPRTTCGAGWTITLTTVAMLTETMIFFCYMALAFVAVVFFKQRGATRNEAIAAILWSGFIFACGMTHLTSRLMFVWPAYHLDTLTRVYTACFSLAACGHAGLVLGGARL